MDDPFYKATINYLSFRPRSIKEVKNYLHKKNVPEETSSTIISFLQKQKFLDDTAFARMWIHARTVGKPKSLSFIKQELSEKGVSEEVITKVVAELHEEIKGDLEQAIVLLEKKIKQYAALERDILYRRAGGYLARRGFSFTIIRKSIDQVFQK
jgi:regulatory protein